MMRRLTQAVLLIVVICCARQARGTCTFTVSSMSFGSYTGGGAAWPGTAIGTWTGNTCAGNWEIPLGPGLSPKGTETTRYMTGPGGQTLGYGVFQDTGHQTYWGNTATTEKTGTSYLPVTFYGLITALQYPTPGTYTDTLATATATFPVSVTVLSGCAVTATNLAFGNYVATAALTSTSIITVTCTNTTPYNVGLSAGASGSVTARAMTGPGGHTLGYGLYQDTGHGTNWGVTIGTNTEAGIGTGSAQTLTVYGQIPKGEFAVAGAYTDTITATVTY